MGADLALQPVAVVALRAGALLAAAGLVLGVLHLRRRPVATLGARLGSWAAIAVVWFGALAVPPLGPVLLAAALGLAGGREYGRLVALPPADRRVVALAGAALPLASARGGLAWMVALALAALASTLPPLLAQDVEAGWDRLGRSALGLLWVGGGATAVAVLPVPALLVLGPAVALADVGAYLGGRTAGRRPLAPRLSPAKTVEGVVGAVAGATAGVLVAADAVGWPVLLAPVAGAAVAVCATWGDLLESLIKRQAGVKDAGAWLPGFGGLLDRADSILVVAPAAWALTAVLALVGEVPA